jgi:GDP/UDP-N,N'-diacetylbacillosamine 2-epimerase (hydrolysing)
MNRKICVITGTRAEYGLLRWVMDGIRKSPVLELQVVATGMHLSPEFGLTYREIEKDGFMIDRKVEMLLSSDTPSAITKSTGLGMIGFADVMTELRPDLVVILGDRYEMLAGAFAAVSARIPIAHIQGGETTQGAFDESIRHSISKMSWWHFVAADEYRKRVIQLGEDPERVFNVGGLGVDAIGKLQLLSKEELIQNTGIRFARKNLLVTFHPVTLENQTSEKQFQDLLDVLYELDDVSIIFTMPNADSDGRVIKKMIEEFVMHHSSKAVAFSSMGQLNYLSALQFVNCVVGNSSSGLLEAPTFRVATVNIGDRQKGRLKADSVIDCEPSRIAIENAIQNALSEDFQQIVAKAVNPYGEGNATEKILSVFQNNLLPAELKKKFYDL